MNKSDDGIIATDGDIRDVLANCVPKGSTLVFQRRIGWEIMESPSNIDWIAFYGRFGVAVLNVPYKKPHKLEKRID